MHDPRPSPAGGGMAATAPAAAALSLLAAALARAAGLLAGGAASAGALAAAGACAGAALGMALDARRATPATSRVLAIAAAACTLGAALVVPAMAARGGWLAWGALAAGTALPAALAGAAGLLRGWPRLLGGAATGALAAALALPFAGPFGVAAAAAALLVLAGVARAPAESPDAPPPSSREEGGFAWGCAFALLGGWAVTTTAATGLSPWPAPIACAAAFLAGGAVGAVLARGTRSIGWILASAVLVLVGAAAPLAGARLLAAWAFAPRLPSVGVAGGLLALLAVAALVGFAPGVGVGLLARRPGGAGALLGAAFGMSVLVTAREVDWLLLLAGLALFVAAIAESTGVGSRADGTAGRRAPALLVLVALAVVLAGHVALAAAPRRWPLDASLAPHASGPRTRGGRVLARGLEHAPQERYAAHVAGRLTAGRGSAVVVGWDPVRTAASLRLHGFADVAERVPAPAVDGGAPGPLVGTPAEAFAGGPHDAIVSLVDDPAAGAWLLTDRALEALRESLRPGGAYVQALSLDALGPEGLLRALVLLRGTFPDVHLVTADLGRAGTVLAVAVTPEAGAPATRPAGTGREGISPAAEPRGPAAPEEAASPSSPDARAIFALPDFTDLSALPARAREDVRRALLLTPDALLRTLVAGPGDIARLAEGYGALDPWMPGTLAFRHPAPPDTARLLARALLYDAVPNADVRVRTTPRPAQSAGWEESWPAFLLETRLGPGWSLENALVRLGNRYTELLGAPGVYREVSWRLELRGPGRSLEVVERQEAMGGDDVLMPSIDAFRGEHAMRQGRALVHDHPALWLFEQPSRDEQVLSLTWHCPVHGRLYLARQRITENVRPSLHEEPLEQLLRSVRCLHGAAPAVEPGAASGGEAGTEPAAGTGSASGGAPVTTPADRPAEAGRP